MKRPAVIVGLPFVIGAFAACCFLSGALIVFAALTLIISVFAVLPISAVRALNLRRFALPAAMLGVGILLCAAYSAAKAPDTEKADGKVITAVGEVAEIKGKVGEYGEYLLINAESESLGKKPSSIIVYAPYNGEISYGDTLTVSGEADEIEKASPSAPNYKSRGIYLTIMSYGEAEITEKSDGGLKYAFKRLNKELRRKAEGIFSSRSAGLTEALLLGNRDNISDKDNLSLKRAGISHAFVVSGMHIGIICGFVLWLLGLFRFRRRVRNAAALLCVWAAVALTGMGISSIRAGIMTSILLLAPFFRRKADGLNSLLVAAAVIIAVNPLAAADSGFLLTFSSTAGIMLLYKPIFEAITEKIKIKNEYIRPIVHKLIIIPLSLTLSASVGMFPITLWVFKGMSAAAPITNIVVLPVITLMMLFGALSFFPVIGGVFAAATDWIGRGVLAACRLIGGGRFSYIGLNYPYIWLCAALIALICAACYFIYRKRAVKIRNLIIRTAVCGAAAAILAVGAYTYRTRGDVTIKAIGSDGSKSVAVTYRGFCAAVVFDDSEYANYRLCNYLQTVNHNDIDHLIFMGDRRSRKHIETFNDALSVGAYYGATDEAAVLKSKFGRYSEENGYLLLENDDVKITLENGILLIKTPDKSAAVSDDFNAIYYNLCDYNFIFSEYDKKAENFSESCGILLKRPRLERERNSIPLINGYSREPQITLR